MKIYNLLTKKKDVKKSLVEKFGENESFHSQKFSSKEKQKNTEEKNTKKTKKLILQN